MERLAEIWKRTWFGLVFACMGLFSMAMVLLHPEGAHAPIWVVLTACGTFVFAGVSLVVRGLGVERMATLIALPAVYGLAVPGLWLLVAGDGQRCTATANIGGFVGSDVLDSLMCRGVFGFGGLLVLAMAVAFTVVAVRRNRSGKRPGSDGSTPAQ